MASPKRLVIATQYFPPDTSATGRLMADIALAFQRAGFEVDVVTGPIAYGTASNEDQVEIDPSPPVRVYRVRSTRFSRNGPLGNLGRLVNIATFSLSVAWICLRVPRPAVILCVTTPPTLGFIGALVRRLRRTRFIYVLHDLYPDVAIQHGLLKEEGLATRILRWASALALNAADVLVTLGTTMQSYIDRHYPGVHTPKVIIPNWASPRLIQYLDSAAQASAKQRILGVSPDAFVVQYAGNLGVAHDWETIVGAAQELQFDGKVVFAIVGSGTGYAEMKKRCRELGLQNVRFYPYQPWNVLAELLGAADVSLVTLRPGFEGLVVPSKVYSILASGRPIISVTGRRNEVTELIKVGRCGVSISNGDSVGLARAIQAYRHNPQQRMQDGMRARTLFEDSYTDRVVTPEYVQLARQLLGAENEGAQARE